MLLLKDLPISARLKIAVGLGVLGIDNLTIVVVALPHIVRCIFHLRLNIYQLADSLTNGLVEVDEEVVALLEERTDIVSIILKERTLAVGRHERIPVNASPLVMVADAEIFHQGLLVRMLHRNG